MLVTNQSCLHDHRYLDFVETCIRGGVSSVQLRIKNQAQDRVEAFGRKLLKLLKADNIPLIINDDVSLCLKLGVDGVHLGQSDGDIGQARQILGTGKIIGLTVDSFEQLEIANKLPIDYVGIGAIFPTNNKPDIVNIWGIKGLREVIELSKHPVVAIGGIDQNNIDLIVQTGVSGIAAIGAFHDSPDPVTTTKRLIQAMIGECLL